MASRQTLNRFNRREPPWLPLHAVLGLGGLCGRDCGWEPSAVPPSIASLQRGVTLTDCLVTSLVTAINAANDGSDLGPAFRLSGGGFSCSASGTGRSGGGSVIWMGATLLGLALLRRRLTVQPTQPHGASGIAARRLPSRVADSRPRSAQAPDLRCGQPVSSEDEHV